MLNRLLTDVPFLTEGALAAFSESWRVAAVSKGAETDLRMAEHPMLAKMREAAKPQARMLKGEPIAELAIRGVLARNPDPFEQLFGGVEDTGAVLDMVQSAASNPDIAGILLDFDSPGGFYTGGPEVADAIRAAQSVKPTVAFIGGQGASLAYWMASQAGEIIASRSAQVGSIGSYTTHLDISKMLEKSGVKMEVIKNKEADYKAAGLVGTSLTDQQRDYLQSRNQAGYNEFRAAVKKARPQVSDDSMRGQLFNGIEAKGLGLVDRVGDKSFALSCLRQAMRRKS